MKLKFSRSIYPSRGEWWGVETSKGWLDEIFYEEGASYSASWFFARDVRKWFKKWVFK